MRRVFTAIIFTLAAFSSGAATENAPLGALEFRWLCAPHASECEGIEAIGSTAPEWVEKAPFFATRSVASWAECSRFGDPLLCITLDPKIWGA